MNSYYKDKRIHDYLILILEIPVPDKTNVILK